MPLAELWKLHEQVIVQLRIKLAAETCVAPTRRYFPNIKIREIPLRLGQVAGGSHVGSVHSLGPEKNSTISEFIIHPIALVGHAHKRTQRFSNGGFYRQSWLYRCSCANGTRRLSLLKVIFLRFIGRDLWADSSALLTCSRSSSNSRN